MEFNRNKKIVFGLVFIAVIIGLIFITKNDRSASVETIKIGALLPLSGFAANYGADSKEGIELALSDVKKSYKGLNLEIVNEDSFYNPKGAVDGYNKLRTKGIDFLLAGGSQVAIPVRPLSEKDRVIEFAIWSGSPSYSEVHNLNFRTTLLPIENVPALLSYMESNSQKRLAILHAQNEFGIAYKDAFATLLSTSTSMSIVSSEAFASDASDFRTHLLKIKGANPDSIFYVGAVAQLVQVLKQAREIGITSQFLTQGAAEDQQLLVNAAKEAEGLVYVSIFDHENELAREFSAEYLKRYGKIPSQYAAESYAAIQLIADSLKACDYVYDVSCIKGYLHSERPFSTILGEGWIDARGDLKAGTIFLKTVKDGKFVKLNR